MMPIVGRQIGKRVLESLGIDPKRVHRLSIDIPTNAPVEIKVESYVEMEPAEAFAAELRAITTTYALYPRHHKSVGSAIRGVPQRHWSAASWAAGGCP